jgi:hypothetical protein
MHLLVGDLVEALGVGDLFGVGVVDAVHFCGLEQDIRLDFRGSKRGAGIGGEEGVAGAGGEDDDTALLEVAYGAAADERVGWPNFSIVS